MPLTDEAVATPAGGFTVQGKGKYGKGGEEKEPTLEEWRERALRAERLVNLTLDAVEAAWDDGHKAGKKAVNPYKPTADADADSDVEV